MALKFAKKDSESAKRADNPDRPDSPASSSSSDDVFQDAVDVPSAEVWKPIGRKVVLDIKIEETAVQFIQDHTANRSLVQWCWHQDRRDCSTIHTGPYSQQIPSSVMLQKLWEELSQMSGQSVQKLKGWWLELKDLFVKEQAAADRDGAGPGTIWI